MEQRIHLIQLSSFPGPLHNDDIIEASILLAAALYRRDHGEYPSRLEDLIPSHLDSSILRLSDTEWRIHRVNTFQGPLVRWGDETDSVTRAVRAYQLAHSETPPTSPEDLRPYLAEGTDLESLRENFHWYEERPVFLRLFPTASRRPQPGEDPKVGEVKVLALFPIFPVIPPELVEILRWEP